MNANHANYPKSIIFLAENVLIKFEAVASFNKFTWRLWVQLNSVEDGRRSFSNSTMTAWCHSSETLSGVNEHTDVNDCVLLRSGT